MEARGMARVFDAAATVHVSLASQPEAWGGFRSAPRCLPSDLAFEWFLEAFKRFEIDLERAWDIGDEAKNV